MHIQVMTCMLQLLVPELNSCRNAGGLFVPVVGVRAAVDRPLGTARAWGTWEAVRADMVGLMLYEPWAAAAAIRAACCCTSCCCCCTHIDTDTL